MANECVFSVFIKPLLHFNNFSQLAGYLFLPAASPMVSKPIISPSNKPARTFLITKPMAIPINTSIQIPIVRLFSIFHPLSPLLVNQRAAEEHIECSLFY